MTPTDPLAPEVPGGPDDRILPWSQVKVISGLSRTTIWRMQRTGDFPMAVQVSRKRVGWWQSELLAWKRARTPRRLPEPRAVPDTSQPPIAAPKTKKAPGASKHDGEVCGSGRPSKPSPKRKRAVVPDNQTAFDFGS